MKDSEPIILITGGSGMVGSQAHFGIKPTKEELDITKPETIESAIKKYRPTVILHLAAMTDMRGCEKNPTQAAAINVEGTRNLARACKQYGVKLVYLSTGAVFSAHKATPFTEADQTGPINVYGQTKLQGELEIQKLLSNALIIRTSWLFGGGEKDTKFIKRFFDTLRRNEPIRAVSDRIGSPTYVPDLLDAIRALIQKNAEGTYHLVNAGTASYYDVAEEIKKMGNFTAAIQAVKASDIESVELKRGPMEALYSSKVQLRPWQQALRAYVDVLNKKV